MFADEEKKSSKDLDQERDYYDSYFDEIREAEAEELAKSKSSKKVTIGDPEEPKKFEFSLKNLTAIACFIAIAFFVLAKLFAIVGVFICYAVFYYIGAVAMLCGLGCYLAQVFKNHELKFEPQLVVLLLAAFIGLI